MIVTSNKILSIQTINSHKIHTIIFLEINTLKTETEVSGFIMQNPFKYIQNRLHRMHKLWLASLFTSKWPILYLFTAPFVHFAWIVILQSFFSLVSAYNNLSVVLFLCWKRKNAKKKKAFANRNSRQIAKLNTNL